MKNSLRHVLLWSAALMITLGACGGEQTSGDATTSEEAVVDVKLGTVTVTELKAITDQDADTWVMDVRSPEEYRAVHATVVKQLIVHTEMSQNRSALPADKDAPIYLICRSGRRSKIAGEEMITFGYTNVFNVLGGTTDWVKEGFPTETGSGILEDPQGS